MTFHSNEHQRMLDDEIYWLDLKLLYYAELLLCIFSLKFFIHTHTDKYTHIYKIANLLRY